MVNSRTGRSEEGFAPEKAVVIATARSRQKVRLGGVAEKKMLIYVDRSRNAYENKQMSDRMPGRESDIYV